MTDQNVQVRRYHPADRPAVTALAPRLEIGVAPWRDPHAVRRAVTDWVRGSLDAHDTDGHAVFVAEVDSRILGVVTIGTRQHLTLDTGAGNHAARAFYGSLGYLEEDVRLTKAITASYREEIV